MDVYTTDEERVEALKKWIKQNGLPILIGVALALGASYGWRVWKQHKVNMGAQSSAVYEQMLGAMIEGKPAISKQYADYLLKDFSSTPYAALAALTEAQDAVKKSQLGLAQKRLEWVVGNSKQRVLRQIARIRLARVLLAENKPKRALEIVRVTDDAAYLPLVGEVRGDAYVLLKKKDAARKAYQSAVAASTEAGIKRPLLQMKLDQISTN